MLKYSKFVVLSFTFFLILFFYSFHYLKRNEQIKKLSIPEDERFV